jgi:hypothetical protein
MTADKRTVSTDALETLGMIHTKEEFRDAIHLAVIPAVAGQLLDIGTHVMLQDGIASMAKPYGPEAIGIVDPFLKKHVSPGEKFWVVIYPRQINSLRHVWTHPKIDIEVDSSRSSIEENAKFKKSWAWMERYASSLGVDVVYLMRGAGNFIATGECLSGINNKDKEDCYKETDPEFWHHYNIITGSEIHDVDFFACCC